MYLLQVQGKHWQGGNINHRLAPLTIIGGENQVGKSAIASLIRVGLIGYSPAHGKKAADTFGFAGARDGASSTRIELTTDDGTTVWHEWKMKKKSVSYDGENPFNFPPVLLDVREYLGKSGPDKVRFVFDRIDLAGLGFGLDQLTARLKREVKPKEVTPATEAALGQLIDDIGELDEQRHDLSWTLQAWLDAVIAKVKADRDEALAIVEQMTGSIQATSSLTVQQNAKPITFDKDDLQTARQQVATIDARIRDGVKLIGEITEREDLRDELTAKVKQTVDHTAAIKKLEEDAAALQTKIDAFATTTALELLTQEQNTASGQREQKKAFLEDLNRQLRNAVAGLNLDCDHNPAIRQTEFDARELEQKIAEFKTNIEKLISDRADAINGGREAGKKAARLQDEAAASKRIAEEDLCKDDCPTCHAKGEGWKKELREFVAAKCARLNQEAASELALQAEYVALEKALDGKITTERARIAERDGWQTRATSLRTKARDLTQAQNAIDAAKAKKMELDGLIVQTTAQIARAEEKLAALAPQIEAEKQRNAERDGWEAQVRTWLAEDRKLREAQTAFTEAKAKLDALPPKQSIPDLTNDENLLHAAKIKVVDLEEVERQFIRQQADLARAEEARQKRDASEAIVEVCKLALKVIEAEKADMIAKGFGGFMGKVQMFTDGIMTDRDGKPVKLEFKDGEIGYFYGATWVSADYFSGTQELLTFAGLSIALATTAPIKLVIMDELGRLSAQTKAKLLARVRGLLADKQIDQFIGIDASADSYILTDGEAVLRLA